GKLSRETGPAIMFQELKFQLSTAILTILTVAAGVAAVLNFEQQYRFERLPDDGAIWVDRKGGVQALDVPLTSPAGKAGVRTGDWLKQINGVDVRESSDVPRILLNVRALMEAKYHVVRAGVEFDINKIIVDQAPLDRTIVYQYVVGFAYLLIGL